MTCHVCGGENKPENRFCGSCGVALIQGQPAAAACPSCGNINEPAYKFCGKCGTKLKLQEPAKGNGADAVKNENLGMADAAGSSPRKDPPKLTEKTALSSKAIPSET